MNVAPSHAKRKPLTNPLSHCIAYAKLFAIASAKARGVAFACSARVIKRHLVQCSAIQYSSVQCSAVQSSFTRAPPRSHASLSQSVLRSVYTLRPSAQSKFLWFSFHSSIPRARALNQDDDADGELPAAAARTHRLLSLSLRAVHVHFDAGAVGEAHSEYPLPIYNEIIYQRGVLCCG